MGDASMTSARGRSRFPNAAGCLLAAVLALPGVAAAQFALYVSPPRVEVQAKAGETKRHVLELQHSGLAASSLRFSTNDWALRADNTVLFNDALSQDSCRPWVALERRELKIEPNGKYRYRFEVTPPAGTPQGECRFAIMVEGLDTTKVEQGAFSFPVAGRIAVIVYVQVEGASPKLAIGKPGVREVKGIRQPVIEVTNSGNATGRLEGFLTAVDAAGVEFELTPESLPILPGVTKSIALLPTEEGGKKPPTPQYPLRVKGTLEWGKSRDTVELRFAP
jgi:hypothetical protein